MDTSSNPEPQAASPEPPPRVIDKSGEPEVDEMTTLHERTIAALSYVSFLAIIPFYFKKDSKFCRFHGKQGLVIAIIFHFSQLLLVLNFFDDLAKVLQFVIFVTMGFAALAGRWKKVPWIYDISCQAEEVLSIKTKEEDDEEALRPDEVRSGEAVETAPPNEPTK